jgi:hypothetical protein
VECLVGVIELGVVTLLGWAGLVLFVLVLIVWVVGVFVKDKKGRREM